MEKGNKTNAKSKFCFHFKLSFKLRSRNVLIKRHKDAGRALSMSRYKCKSSLPLGWYLNLKSSLPLGWYFKVISSLPLGWYLNLKSSYVGLVL
jgi:hypothetical protein